MKRFIFAGLFLSLLTLCSCSRKKNQVSSQPEPQSGNTGVLSEQPQLSDINKEEIGEEQTSLSPDEDFLPDEEFLAQEERLGTEVLNFLEDEANFTSPIIEDSEEKGDFDDEEAVPEVETVEKRLLDSYNRIKVMEYGSELFIPVVKEDSSIVVHYSDKNAVRLFYDNLYRLTKKEYWKMESVDNSKLTGTEKYSYEGESKKPYEKKIESEEAVFVSKFNENGLVIRTEKFTVDGEQSLSLSKGPVQTTTWTYDDKKRITSETLSTGGLVKKQVFNYSKTDGEVQSSKVQTKDNTEQSQDNDSTKDSEEEIPPDYEYYENGVLVTKTEYVKKGVYSTTIWFDSSNSVRTDYENHVKVREVYYTNGIERRVKSYE